MKSVGSTYAGSERRHHCVFVTKNTEYHLRDKRCVAVRDRKTGTFLGGHLALHCELEGSIHLRDGSIVANLDKPSVGDLLCFFPQGKDLVTSPIQSIFRPNRQTVAGYNRPPRFVRNTKKAS